MGDSRSLRTLPVVPNLCADPELILEPELPCVETCTCSSETTSSFLKVVSSFSISFLRSKRPMVRFEVEAEGKGEGKGRREEKLRRKERGEGAEGRRWRGGGKERGQDRTSERTEEKKRKGGTDWSEQERLGRVVTVTG